MRSAFTAAVLLLLTVPVEPLIAQVAQVPSESIGSFSLRGAEARMSPEQARAALLEAGFEDDGLGADWTTTAVRTFSKGKLEVAIGHVDGERITGLNEVRIWDGTPFDYAEDIQRIEAHLGPGAEGRDVCTELSYGARCAARSVDGDGWSLVASLTPEMIFIRIEERSG